MSPERVIRVNPPRVERDTWRIVEAAETDLPRGAAAVSLDSWKQRREALLARIEPVGVWLSPADDPEALGRDLHALSLVAVHFPKFVDGRGYSTGAVLRRLGYRGELRAFGDVGRDHLLQLRRCGFDAFVLAAGRDPEAALVAFNEFSHFYQGSVEDPVPLFRQRFSGGAA
jgi:uncharacterized protein (DUF934 family)